MKLNSRSHKFQFVGELKSNRICHGFVAVALFFGFSRLIFVIRRFESFDVANGLISENTIFCFSRVRILLEKRWTCFVIN